MYVHTVWRIKLDGKHRNVELFHNVADGSGHIGVDGAFRQIFGARIEPTSSKFAFDVVGRNCIVRIQLTQMQSYHYECEINGTVLVADYDQAARGAMLLRPTKAPSDELLRPATAHAVTPADDLLVPVIDSPDDTLEQDEYN